MHRLLLGILALVGLLIGGVIATPERAQAQTPDLPPALEDSPAAVMAFWFCTQVDVGGSNQPIKVFYASTGHTPGVLDIYYLDYRPVFERIDDLAVCMLKFLEWMRGLPLCLDNPSIFCLNAPNFDSTDAITQLHLRLRARLAVEMERVNALNGVVAPFHPGIVIGRGDTTCHESERVLPPTWNCADKSTLNQ